MLNENMQKFANSLSFAFSTILKQHNEFISVCDGSTLNVHKSQADMLAHVKNCHLKGVNVATLSTQIVDDNCKRYLESVKLLLGGKDYILFYRYGFKIDFVILGFSDLNSLLNHVRILLRSDAIDLLGMFDFLNGDVVGGEALKNMMYR